MTRRSRYAFVPVFAALLAVALAAPLARAADNANNATATAEKPKAVTPEVQTAKWAVKWWMPRHEQKLADAKKMDKIDLLWIGDSITHGWENAGKSVWDEFYADRNAFNIGFSGDRTEQVIWRLQHNAVDGMKPKLAIMMIGTNNTGHRMDPPDEIAAGVRAILDELRTRLPDTKILVLAIFPRAAEPDHKMRVNNAEANKLIAKFADGQHIYFLDINDKFLTDDGTLTKEVMPDLLHPKEKGYRIWAEAIEPTVKKLMGEK